MRIKVSYNKDSSICKRFLILKRLVCLLESSLENVVSSAIIALK